MNTPDHIVVVIEENHDADQVIGNPNAPYINGTLLANGLYYSNAHGTDHPSQPNYLEMFAGTNPGVPGVNTPLQQQYPVGQEATAAGADALNNGDNFNAAQPFSSPNLGAELLASGHGFAGYSEDLPSAGFTGVQANGINGNRSYVEKHNPWAQFQGDGTNQLPADTNQPFTTFQNTKDFAALPTVSYVVPNEYNDMHDTVGPTGLYAVGTTGVDANGNPVNDNTTIQNGDAWLSTNLEAYREWAVTHNSLLVTVWDENDYDFSNNNDIPMIVDGDPRLVQQGVNSSYVNHFDLLKTLEQDYGLGLTGAAATANGLASNASGQLAADLANTADYAGTTPAIVANLQTRTVDAGSTHDVLSPTANTIIGTSQDDSFVAAPGSGNWQVVGGSGHDTLTLLATPQQAVVSAPGDGSATVVMDGAVIHTAGVETIAFSDGSQVTVGQDWNALAAQALANFAATGHWFI